MTEAEFLKSYNPKVFDAPLCTVDMAIFAVEEGELKVLLIKRAEHPSKGRWALPGGFCDLSNDATIDATAHRKLFEKTGINSPYLEQVESIGNAVRDPRGWSITLLYFALIDFETIGAHPQSEHTQWASINEALKCELAFDHKVLLRKAINRLRKKTRYTALPISLMPRTFTLTELQNMFELILGSPLQKKSFRRRIEASGLLEETGDMRATSRRPAALFKRSKNFEEDHIFPGLLDVKLEQV
ncbi:MAG: NUDIX domain-containing protein [Litorimonas sp.]